nr:excalibur calcium-binding domain-containing protein [Mycobacterium lentiflavum]
MRVATTTAAAPSPSTTPIYRNCDEAHKDGRWDIPKGDPAYRPELDHNGDGIACESRKPG